MNKKYYKRSRKWRESLTNLYKNENEKKLKNNLLDNWREWKTGYEDYEGYDGGAGEQGGIGKQKEDEDLMEVREISRGGEYIDKHEIHIQHYRELLFKNSQYKTW